ncbi:MAG: ABC transporter ATP-binding protein [Bacteroidales bacterium]
MIRKIWAVSAGYRLRILISTLLGLGSVVTSILFIWASKRVIDIATGDVSGSFLMASLLTGFLLLLQLGMQCLNHRLSIRLQAGLSNQLRSRLFKQLMHSSWNETERFRTGDLMTRIMQDNNEVVRLLAGTIPQIIITATELFCAFVFLYLLNAGLALTILFITPIFLLLSKLYLKRMRFYSRQIKRSDSRINTMLHESFTHRTVLKTLEYIPLQIQNLNDLQTRLMRQTMNRGNLSVFSNAAVSVGFSTGYLIAFLWGGVQIQSGAISFGTMTAFLQLASKIQTPALGLIRLLPSLISTWTASERLMELETLKKETGEEKHALEGDLTLSLQNVSYGYHSETPVLRDVTMEFKAATMTAVMGETGAGKTTLIRLLLGLILPRQGEITVSNRQKKIGISAGTRCNFVYVPQGNTLFATSIRNNLLMGNPNASQEELHEALHTAAADFVFDLPNGIYTRLGEQGSGLSEGQAQRIAIARALLRPGGVVILDEATSALDMETEALFLKRLKKRLAGRTVIFITHHPVLAKSCDMVYRIGN